MSDVLSKEPLTFDIEPNLLEDRLDPYYYEPKFLRLVERIKSSNYEVKTIRHIRKSIEEGRITPKRSAYVEKGIPFIRAQNIAENQIGLDGVKRIKREVHDEIKKSQARPNDVLLTIDGVKLGIATVVPADLGECTISNHMVRIKLEEKVNPKYVSTFLNLNLGQMQIKRGISGSAIPGLRIDSIEKILIPIPPKEIQNKIAEIMQNAYKEGKSKLDRAEKLLNSINDIILKELGIELPEIEDKKIYEVDPEDLEDRLDPMYYHPKYAATIKQLMNGKYPLKTVGKISKMLISGRTPSRANYVESGIPFVRITNITEEGMDFNELAYLPNELYDEFKRAQINRNDIVIAITGATIGKTSLIEEDPGKCLICADIAKIVVKDSINPTYVSTFLKSAFGQLQLQKHIYGATNKHLSASSLRIIKIPIPPREIQDNIREEVKRRKEEFKRLIKEADEVIENAKRRIEQIILKGEDIS